VLEHLWADTVAIAELTRVLRPGGRMAVTVPTRWPERVCWALDHHYHDTPGGHVRIYRQHELEGSSRLRTVAARLAPRARAALAVLVAQVRGGHRPPRHAVAVTSTTTSRVPDHQAPRWLETVDRALNPVLGKSLVVYTQKVSN
jgi:SAM-dependent methyltransferase